MITAETMNRRMTRYIFIFFFFQAEDGIRDDLVTGVQTCALPISALPGFPSRSEIAERYVARSGRDVEPLPWFEALALWKAAVFCEAIYGRFVRGELGAEDTGAARFERGVPYLAEAAAAAVARG